MGDHGVAVVLLLGDGWDWVGWDADVCWYWRDWRVGRLTWGVLV